MRALVLHATPTGDHCVSACEGTATTVLVCRTISPFRPSHLDLRICGHIRAPFQLRRTPLAFTLLLTWQTTLVCQIPPTVLASSICAMMHGLAILLPESALVQSPLRLSPCAHTNMHTRIRMRASSARLAVGAVTAGGYGISTAAGHIAEHVPHRKLVQTRISKCGESSDDIALTSPTRGWLSDGAFFHLLCRVPSHRSSGLLVLQCQGSRFVARGGRARSGACVHGVWHVLDIHG